MLLEGRCALVTGGARGMGRSIALTLAAEGADVAVFDLLEDGAREVAAAVRERGRRATYRVVDITDYEAVTGAVGEVLEELGAIHILVNNAGVWTPRPFAESGPREWDRDIRVNLYGVLHCTRAVLPQMIRLGYGKIVSITSEAGRVGEPNVAAYSAAKAGVIGFTKALAREVGRHGINVNCVAMATTRTPQTEPGLTPETVQKILRHYVIRRLGEPEDAAAAVLFLVSDRASWVTGQTLGVNGGYAMP